MRKDLQSSNKCKPQFIKCLINDIKLVYIPQ